MKSDFAMLHFSICPEMAVTGCVVPRKVKESPPTAKQGDLGSHGRKIKWDFCMSSSCMWKKWASKEHVWELEDTVSVEAPPRRQLYSWQVLLFHLSSLAASIPTFRVPSPVNTCTSGTAILVFKSGITKNTEHHLPMMTSQVPVGQTFFWLLGGVFPQVRSDLPEGQRGSCIICSSAFLCCPLTCHSTGPYSFCTWAY